MPACLAIDFDMKTEKPLSIFVNRQRTNLREGLTGKWFFLIVSIQ